MKTPPERHSSVPRPLLFGISIFFCINEKKRKFSKARQRLHRKCYTFAQESNTERRKFKWMQSHETESLEQWPRQLTEIKQIDCSHSLVADVRLKKIMLSARWKWCTFRCSSQHIYCYYYYYYLTVSTVFFCCVACHHLADDHRMCNRSIFCILYCVMHWLQCVRLLCVCMCGWLTQNTMMQVNTFEHASRCTAVMHKHECLSTINPWHPIGLHYGVWTRVRQGDYNRRGRLMSHRWN